MSGISRRVSYFMWLPLFVFKWWSHHYFLLSLGCLWSFLRKLLRLVCDVAVFLTEANNTLIYKRRNTMHKSTSAITSVQLLRVHCEIDMENWRQNFINLQVCREDDVSSCQRLRNFRRLMERCRYQDYRMSSSLIVSSMETRWFYKRNHSRYFSTDFIFTTEFTITEKHKSRKCTF